MMSHSKLEAQFALAWRVFGDGTQPVREFKFGHSLERLWQFDFCFPGKIAVEIDGGQHAYKGGRHNTDKDRDKLNHAACLGYRVLRFSGTMLHDPENCVRMVRWALEGK